MLKTISLESLSRPISDQIINSILWAVRDRDEGWDMVLILNYYHILIRAGGTVGTAVRVLYIPFISLTGNHDHSMKVSIILLYLQTRTSQLMDYR